MESKKIPTIAIVVPCYNEAEMLGITIPRLISFVEDIISSGSCTSDSFIVLVDDGSKDDTWKLIAAAAKREPGRLRGLRLACNVGHQGALLSGLDYATDRCDAAVSIDADLQHDLTAILQMLNEFCLGAEVVLGVRETRAVDTWFKRTTAVGFYKLMRWMGVDIVENHADFRLMSANALRNLRKFSEVNLFLRGLPPLLHRKIATVPFQVAERAAGKSKYTLRKMLGLAWNGITSFSVVPLRLVSIVGSIIFLFSIFMIVYAIFGTLAGKTVPGWASVVIPIYFLGGLLMLSIGVVGEYVGKLFLEAKRRPRFLVDTIIGGSENDD